MAACYSTPQPDCGFVCGPSGECPADYQCGADKRCHLNGTPSSLVCAVDAPPPLDAKVFLDARVGEMVPPVVVSIDPADGATDVARTTTITVTFDETVQNVSTATFLVEIASNAVTGMVDQLTSDTYRFTPGATLAPNEVVTVSLTGGITDLSSNSLAAVSFSFETGS